jgi:hypothetical protein
MRDRLLKALRAMGECCHSPLEEALWPLWEQLNELHSAVVGLAMIKGKKPITLLTPYWKAYERVNKWEPQLRLIPRVKELVGRADKLSKEAGESELVRLRRKASEGLPEAQQLTEYLEAIQEDARAAGKIEWENCEGLLFARSDNKPVQLACDSPTSSRVRCYARALEIIVDDLSYRPLRDQSLPLLTWIAGIGSPYADLLQHDYRAQYCADYMTRRRADETRKRKQEQWKLRKKRQRLKKLETSLRAKDISEDEVQKILAANA